MFKVLFPQEKEPGSARRACSAERGVLTTTQDPLSEELLCL